MLWELQPGYTIPGPQTSANVPAGKVWVVREALAANIATGGNGLGLPSLLLQAGAFPIWQTPVNRTATGIVYELRDARVVLEAADFLAVNLSNPNWFLRVSGYSLTA